MKRKNFIQTLIGISTMTAFESLKKLSGEIPEEEEMMPVLFIGHGSPMNAIEDNEFSRRWVKMGRELPEPKLVLCISAHWLTGDTRITAMESPRTIHDFGGFPPELFEARYPAPGSPAMARQTKDLIKSTPVTLDHDWGLDHGAWSVVKQMYPKAEIPVLQLSVNYSRPAAWHYELGKELVTLRKKGVLIMGSGNMVHNLRMITLPKNPGGADALNQEYGYDWAIEMNQVFKEKILSGNHQALINYPALNPAASLAIPTPDHYYPLLYILALQAKNEKIEIFNDKAVAGSITMTSVKIG